jgi:drug/metabolite transporter (DMT)-like permease
VKVPARATFVAAALVATLCWGAGMTLTKLALNYFEPALLLVIQLIASVGFLVCVACALRVRRPSLKSLAGIWWLGVLEPGLAYFLGLEGLKRISAAEAVVLSSTESILVVVLAWLFVKERLRGTVLVLAVIGASGAVLVAGSHFGVGSTAASLSGDALLIGGVLCAAAYVVLSSRVASVTEPLSALIAQQGVAVLLAVGMVVFFGTRPLAIQHVAMQGWALAVASGIVQYACAFWFYLWALKGLSAGVAGLYLSLIPVFGLLVAIPVLGDHLTAVQWLGAALIVGSVVVLTWLRDEHQAAAASVAAQSAAASAV